MEVIILAGGEGTRLKRLVFDRPKPLADINGEPFLSILMNYLVKQGCNHFVLATGYKREMIRSHFGDHFHGIPITYSEEVTPLGTGGALINAQKMLVKKNEPFAVLNGDSFFPIPISRLIEKFHETRSDLIIALFRTLESHRYGAVEFDNDGLITSTDKKAKAGEMANGGIFFFKPEKLYEIKNINFPWSFESDLLPTLRNLNARITGASFNDPFIDIGVPKDYECFCEIVKSQRLS